MSALISTSRQTVILRWQDPHVDDFVPLHAALKALSDSSPGRPIHYVGVTDDRSGQTTAEFREKSLALARGLLQQHQNMALFILLPLETGVQASLMRSMLRSMVAVGRLVDKVDIDRVRVATSIDEAARLLGDAVDAAELRRFLEAEGAS